MAYLDANVVSTKRRSSRSKSRRVLISLNKSRYSFNLNLNNKDYFFIKKNIRLVILLITCGAKWIEKKIASIDSFLLLTYKIILSIFFNFWILSLVWNLTVNRWSSSNFLVLCRTSLVNEFIFDASTSKRLRVERSSSAIVTWIFSNCSRCILVSSSCFRSPSTLKKIKLISKKKNSLCNIEL